MNTLTVIERSSYKELKWNQCDLADGIINNYELPHILSVEVEELNAQIMVWKRRNINVKT